MKETPTVTLVPLGRTLQVARGALLSDAIQTIWASNLPAAARELRQLQSEAARRRNRTSPQHRTVLERKGRSPEWRLACLSRVEEDLTIEVAQFDNIAPADETPFRFTPREGRGIAVDLGSTTIVSQLLDLDRTRTGRPDRYQSAGPPWGRHHVTYQLCDTVEEHAARLVRETVGRHVMTLTAQAPGPIDRIRIVGNSATASTCFCGSTSVRWPLTHSSRRITHVVPRLNWAGWRFPKPSLRSVLLKRNTPIGVVFPPQNRTTRVPPFCRRQAGRHRHRLPAQYRQFRPQRHGGNLRCRHVFQRKPPGTDRPGDERRDRGRLRNGNPLRLDGGRAGFRGQQHFVRHARRNRSDIFGNTPGCRNPGARNRKCGSCGYLRQQPDRRDPHRRTGRKNQPRRHDRNTLDGTAVDRKAQTGPERHPGIPTGKSGHRHREWSYCSANREYPAAMWKRYLSQEDSVTTSTCRNAHRPGTAGVRRGENRKAEQQRPDRCQDVPF